MSAARGPAPVVAAERRPDDRPLRRDAELNLERILDAARDLFAEVGYEASMEQIAARAGVGVGTLYRRFPNKEDLLGAVTTAATDRVRQLADDVLAEEPPGEALFVFLRRCVLLPPSWRAISARAPWPGGTPASELTRVSSPIERMLENAQQSGTVRADVTYTDLSVALMSVRAAADRCRAMAPRVVATPPAIGARRAAARRHPPPRVCANKSPAPPHAHRPVAGRSARAWAALPVHGVTGCG